MRIRRTGWVLTGWILVTFGAAHAADRSPLPNRTFPAGTFLEGLVVEDFNEDGFPDFVYDAINGVEIRLGGGPDLLSPPTMVSTPDTSVDRVAAADLNLDGHLDLIIVGRDHLPPGDSGAAVIALGGGDGTFTIADDFSVPDRASTIMIRDFNSDGVADVAINFFIYLTGGPPGVAIRLGNGDGTFGAENVLSAGDGFFAISERMDSDLTWDLMVTDGNQLLMYPGDGAGGFGTAIAYPLRAREIAAADLNADTVMDLAVTDSGLKILLGNGDGTFTAGDEYDAGIVTQQVTVTDLDDDDVADLVVSSPSRVLAYSGLGDGSFEPASDNPIATLGQLKSADLDQDGKMDVLVGAISEIGVLFGNGDGTFDNRSLEVPFEYPGFPPFFADPNLLADFDLDGFDDVALSISTCCTFEQVSIMFGNADGTFEPGPTISGIAQVAGRFNGDNLPDLAFTDSIWINLGNRNFAPLAFPAATLPASVQVAVDLNGDSREDLVGPGWVALATADLTFGPVTSFPVGTLPAAVTVAHLNNDAFVDVAVLNQDSDDVSVLLGNGGSSFQPSVSYPVGQGPVSIVAEDLNGDAANDLVVTNLDSEDFTVLMGNGDGSFAAPTHFPFAWRPSWAGEDLSATPGDFDRDGHVDLLIDEGRNGTLAFWKGSGDGGFDATSLHSLPGTVITMDLDEDGWLDFAFPNWNGRFIVLLHAAAPGGLGFEADRATLRWPGDAGADGYNVYRGDISSFIDANLDGLVDGGYGVCSSALDPDTSDTVFTDTEVPTAGGDVYFYLRSVVSEGVESDLGSASVGLSRFPEVVCP